MKKVLVFSNKFSAAHFSHLVAFYKSFKELGYECSLILDRKYDNFIKEYNEDLNYKYNDNLTKNDVADYIVIYNISKLDKKYINIIKTNNTKISVIIHEPWCGVFNTLKNYLSKREPLSEIIKSFGRKYYLSKLLKLNSNVIVCSNNALNIYKKYNKKKNVVNVFPLIFADEQDKKCNIKGKKYFSFIGSSTPAHGFDEYIKFIKENKKSDMLFQIATSSNISSYLEDNILKQMIKEHKLIVKEGRYLSNKEINDAFRNSIVTWMVYKRSTQSGVICKSWMFNTPVICSNIGSFKEYIDKGNGRILDNLTSENITKCYNEICDNLNELAISSRNSFEKFFYYKTHLNLLNEIINA